MYIYTHTYTLYVFYFHCVDNFVTVRILLVQGYCQVNTCVIFSYRPFVGAFAKLRKAAIGFVMSVRLSVRMKQFGSHCSDFNVILFEYFSRICREKSSFIKI